MQELFKKKFNFSANYFSTLLELVKKGERKFPQALIFEGSDTYGQYLFALELARILNCQNDGNPDCDCINCRWIKSFSHPAIQNVSQIHSKPEGDETKTVISVKQASAIENSLLLASDYHRFFIFFSSKEKELEPQTLSDFSLLGYSSDINYEIKPLTYSTFHPTTPNALLKSIEEPPEKTTFVFLTKSKEDILPTIVSRCLTFKLSGEKKQKQADFSLFQNYLNLKITTALDFSDLLLNYLKECDEDIETLLNMFLEYLLSLIKANLDNSQLILKLENDIKMVNQALVQSKASMQDKIVLEALTLRLARGY